MCLTDCGFRRCLFASAVLFGLVSVLGISSRRLAAEPSAPAAASPQYHFTARPTRHDYTATVKVSLGPNAKANEFTFAIPAGEPGGSFAFEYDRTHRMELSVETDEKHDPAEHSVQIEVVKLGGKRPAILMAPTLRMPDGVVSVFRTEGTNGDVDEVDVSVSRSKACK